MKIKALEDILKQSSPERYEDCVLDHLKIYRIKDPLDGRIDTGEYLSYTAVLYGRHTLYSQVNHGDGDPAYSSQEEGNRSALLWQQSAALYELIKNIAARRVLNPEELDRWKGSDPEVDCVENDEALTLLKTHPQYALLVGHFDIVLACVTLRSGKRGVRVHSKRTI
jgi:hypothetical protein